VNDANSQSCQPGVIPRRQWPMRALEGFLRANAGDRIRQFVT